MNTNTETVMTRYLDMMTFIFAAVQVAAALNLFWAFEKHVI